MEMWELWSRVPQLYRDDPPPGQPQQLGPHHLLLTSPEEIANLFILEVFKTGFKSH